MTTKRKANPEYPADAVCTSGHTREEHVPGFIAECTAKDCPCRDFEVDEIGEDANG